MVLAPKGVEVAGLYFFQDLHLDEIWHAIPPVSYHAHRWVPLFLLLCLLGFFWASSVFCPSCPFWSLRRGFSSSPAPPSSYHRRLPSTQPPQSGKRFPGPTGYRVAGRSCCSRPDPPTSECTR